MSQLDFRFEFGSTYSYLAAMRVESLAEAERVAIVWRPFLLGPIFREQGWDDSKLAPAQKRRLVRLIAKGPIAYGYRTDIWACDRVRRLIWREFRVRYHRDHVGRVLHQLGLSPQKPERRALERNEGRIKRWRRKCWPREKETQRAGGRTSSSSTSRGSSGSRCFAEPGLRAERDLGSPTATATIASPGYR